jgi:hypothetical protein
MSIKINKTSQGNFEVNGKPIFTDMNGNLLQTIELTPEELKAFNEFLISDAREASEDQSK